MVAKEPLKIEAVLTKMNHQALTCKGFTLKFKEKIPYNVSYFVYLYFRDPTQ
jgi:hypothetical protein